MGGTISTVALTATGHYLAVIFQPIPGKTIDSIEARCTASTSGVVDFKLESVSAGAFVPSGSLIATGAEATSVSVAANTYYSNTFTTPYAVPESASNVLAAVIRWVSGSATFNSRYASPPTHLPRVVENPGSVTQRAFPAMITVIYSDGFRHPINAVASTVSSASYTSASTPDEWGNVYIPDSNQRVSGIALSTRMATSSGMQLRIYDDALNVLTVDAETILDERYVQSTSVLSPLRVMLKAPVSLIAGRTYYITAYATTANAIYYAQMQCGDATRRAAFSPLMYQATRTNQTGAITTTDTNVIFISPIIDSNYGLARDGMLGGISI
jgi:hypothetical protein